MRCPKCAQELDGHQDCPSCAASLKTPAPAIDAPEHQAEMEPVEIPAPPSHQPPGEPPQVVDSSKNAEPEDKPSESRSAAPPATEDTETANTLNKKGDIKIIEQAKQDLGRLDETTVRDTEMRAGRDLFVGNFSVSREQARTDEQKLLYQLTKKRPQRSPQLPGSVVAEVGGLSSQLRRTRILFISCAFRELAIEAGYAATAGLKIANPDQDRILRYADAAAENLEFRFERLLDHLPEEGETAIVVDASDSRAETFPNSILNDKAWIDIIKDDLESNNLFLVVTVSAGYARRNLTQANLKSFAYWLIPFLRPFLEQNYPLEHQRLEAEILQQRAQGAWEEDEINFCQQIISLHHHDLLPSVVSNGGPQESKYSPELLLQSCNEVEQTALYTAAFFQQITAPEFCRVVEALLGKRIRRNSAPVNTNNGADSAAASPGEVPLQQIWEEEKDGIFTKLLLETGAGPDALRIVCLAESSLREPLRKLFERKHRFYLIDQFKRLQESGVFFYPSLRLAESTTQIAVEMIRLYPDEFNEGWIVALVIRLSRHFTSSQLADSGDEDLMFQFLCGPQAHGVSVAFARVADICRCLLEARHQEGIVSNSLEFLMKAGYHEEVLWLTKQLKFSPEFDDLYWLKQLLSRADSRTRHLTYYYLYAYLKRMGSGVYTGLTTIESWLPRTNRDTYSPLETFVFRLLIQYCLETVDRFDTKHYGKWPSRYPLFAVKDEETTRARTSLLARWLLHPGIESTLKSLRIGGNQMALIGALLAEWSFILLGQSATPQAESPIPSGEPEAGPAAAEEVPETGYSAASLCKLLFQQFASRTDLTQRLELLKYWNRLDHDLLKFLSSLSSSSRQRKELTWKRKLVRELVTEIKRVAPTNKPRASENCGAVNVRG